MSTVHKVAKNTIIMVLGNLTFRFISLFIVVYIARYLGVEGFGKYNFIFAYIGFFAIITDLGLGTIVVREMSRDAKTMPKMLGNVHVIKIILSVIAVFLSIFIISLMGYSADTLKYIYVASIILFFQSFTDTYKIVFQTTLKMEYEIIAKLAFKIVSVILILYIISVRGSLFQIIIAITILELFKTLLNHIFSRRIVRASFEIDFTLWKKLFNESLPIALSGVFIVIYHRIDILMLSMMKGDLAVGLYSAAYKLSEPLGLIPYSLVVSLFPVMSRSFKSSTGALTKSYEMGFKYIIISMLPIAVGTTLLSENIIFIIYDQSYSGSITALRILIWSLFITSINYQFTTLLTSINKQKLTTLSMSLCVLVNIVLNYILIPQYSYIGASAATVATELVLFIMSFYFISKNMFFVPIHRLAVKPSIACLIMGMLVYYLNNFTDINIFLTIISAAVIYFISLLGLGVFSSNEKEIMRKIFNI